MTTFDGEPFRLADQREKIVIINFWASGCVPCREEAPGLQDIWERFRDQGVVLVDTADLDSEAESRAFIDEVDITYPNGLDVGTTISEAYRIEGVPETFVVDQTGTIVELIIAPVGPGQLDQIVSHLRFSPGS